MICLATDTIDDLILYLESEEHADMTSRLSIVLMMIFSVIARLISRL